MKIRQGFVSNSSSSSFVIAFPKIPLNVEDVVEIIFKDPEGRYKSDYSDQSFSKKEIAEMIFSDIKKNTLPLNREEIASFFEDDPELLYQGVYMSKRTSEEIEDFLKESEKTVKKRALDKTDKFLRENKNCYFYEFNYSDNDCGIEAVLESGDVFENIPYIEVSHH